MNIKGKDYSDDGIRQLIEGMKYRAVRAFEREKRLLDFLDVIRAISGKEVQDLVDQALTTNHYLLLKDLGQMEELNKQ